MDFLSTLGVSSGSLPPDSGSLPSGLDVRNSTVDRLARIQEFPNESEHSEKGISRRATVAALPTNSPIARDREMESGALAAKKPSPYSPRTPSSRRRASSSLEMSRTSGIGIKVEEPKCLICAAGGREVLVLPCNHLCICRVCAIEEEVKSCPSCFGPVTDKKVAT